MSVRGLVKRFAGVTALRDVSFELRAGEVHAIVGENGAGKSTFIKTLAGSHAPDAGAVAVSGRAMTTFSPAVARAAGIAVVYQQPALFRDLSVAENIALRLERGGLWRVVGWKARYRRAADLLKRVGARRISPDDRVADLSMSEQQLVEIAVAIGAEARVLIFDEPTASIGAAETEYLFDVIRRLRAGGVGIIYVSHRLEELPQIADRVTVLRDGAYVDTREMAAVDRAELIRLMVGRSVEAVFPKVEVPPGDVVLSAKNLGCCATGIAGVNLEVRAGEIVGLAGLVGAGRTELARILFGLTPADAGEVLIDGKAIRIDSPLDAVRHGIAYLPEDRRRHGVVLEMSVAENTTLATLNDIARGGLLQYQRERSVAREFATRLGTKTSSIDAEVGTLSGGNQQKVALSRWLAAKPRVLILDEPTQGVDVGAKSEIHRIMGELARNGLAILLISSELPEVLAMSDRVAVMAGGRIRAMLDRAEATPERVMAHALGETGEVAA